MILKSIKKILNPNFLQRIDQGYLLNYPRLWTSRIHYIIYYSIIGSLFQLLFLNRFEINFERPLNVIMMFCGFELGFLIIGYWFYQQLVYNQNFNILQQYGIIQPHWEWLKDFCFNLICFLISSCTFLMLLTRIVMLLTRIVIEINTANFMLILFFTLFCIFCHLNLLISLQKYTDFKYFSLSLIIFTCGLIAFATLTDLLLNLFSLTNTAQVSLIKKLIILTISSIFILTPLFRSNKNSTFSRIYLILLPYMITFASICLVSLLENNIINLLDQLSLLNCFKIFDTSRTKSVSLYLLSSIIFVPFLPYLANQMIKRLSYPKEI